MSTPSAAALRLCWVATILLTVLPFRAAAEPPPDLHATVALVPVEYRHPLVQRLSLAGARRDEWLTAIASAPAAHRTALAFLLANMPAKDLESLPADYLLRNIAAAYAARDATPWAKQVPEELFLNDVLPYASLNERRDDWRADFAKRFGPLVAACQSTGEAAQVLNREVFKAVNVTYHATKRPKPDQSPYESMEAGFASCSGLSILLVDACRAVGVPARLAGTPMWADGKGNHTWVEVWDGQWRFIGAAEPGPFNQTWFAGNAAKADPASPEHRIYAASFRQTATPFVMVWDPQCTDYPAVDVTGYYVARRKLKAQALDDQGRPATAAVIDVRHDDRLIARGVTSAEFELAAGAAYTLRATLPSGTVVERTVNLARDADAVVELRPSPTTTATATTAPSDLDGDWAKMRPIVPRGYVCRRAAGPVTVDGRPDKPVWKEAAWTEDFVDIEGPRRPNPRFGTRAKMLWDDQNLYVLAELREPHVWGTITRRNEVIFHDNDFEIFLCPSGTHHNYYEFEVNALNTVWELTLAKPYRDGGPCLSPTNIEGLRSAVHVDGTLNDPSDTDRAWCVEVAIPWTGLARYADGRQTPPKDGDQWRANFSRVEWLVDVIDGKYRKIPKEMRPEDNWVWSPTGVVDMHRPERWGYVQFSASDATAAFRPDPTLAARDALMTVYYRQRAYKAKFGHFAASADALGLPPTIDVAPAGQGYVATTRVDVAGGKARVLHVSNDSKLWEDAAPAAPAPAGVCPAPSTALDPLRAWLAKPAASRPPLADQPFARAPLTKAEAQAARDLLWDDHAAALRAARADEWKDHALTIGDHTLKWKQRQFGHKPDGGWNLYISLHGGGGAPAAVNDQQWENQIKLYRPADSLYIAPRAPTNTWNLWHEPHVDGLLDRLIEDAVLLGDVNPNRVYVMGYSAGGDGVYQLAPRMADRWAAAAMMAGHPNDASPLGLRNIGFTAHAGALDAAYKRNEVTAQWGARLDELQKADPGGYRHEVKVHEGRAHWMNLEDAVAVDWMARFTRQPLPDRVVWYQSPVTHERFYWLSIPAAQAKAGQTVIASRSGQEIRIDKAENVRALSIGLNDAMLDLDQPVRIVSGDAELFNDKVARTILALRATLEARGDRESMFAAEVPVELRKE